MSNKTRILKEHTMKTLEYKGVAVYDGDVYTDEDGTWYIPLTEILRVLAPMEPWLTVERIVNRVAEYFNPESSPVDTFLYISQSGVGEGLFVPPMGYRAIIDCYEATGNPMACLVHHYYESADDGVTPWFNGFNTNWLWSDTLTTSTALKRVGVDYKQPLLSVMTLQKLNILIQYLVTVYCFQTESAIEFAILRIALNIKELKALGLLTT